MNSEQAAKKTFEAKKLGYNRDQNKLDNYIEQCAKEGYSKCCYKCEQVFNDFQIQKIKEKGFKIKEMVYAGDVYYDISWIDDVTKLQKQAQV
jgi:hypothetical protein